MGIIIHPSIHPLLTLAAQSLLRLVAYRATHNHGKSRPFDALSTIIDLWYTARASQLTQVGKGPVVVYQSFQRSTSYNAMHHVSTACTARSHVCTPVVVEAVCSTQMQQKDLTLTIAALYARCHVTDCSPVLWSLESQNEETWEELSRVLYMSGTRDLLVQDCVGMLSTAGVLQSRT